MKCAGVLGIKQEYKLYYYQYWAGISDQNIFFSLTLSQLSYFGAQNIFSTNQLKHLKSLHLQTLKVCTEGCFQDAVKM